MISGIASISDIRYNTAKHQALVVPGAPNHYRWRSNVMTEEEHTKKCGRCKEVKARSEFTKSKSRKDGLSSQCKACRRIYNKANKDKVVAQVRVWKLNNPLKVAKSNKKYNDSHKENIAKLSRAYYEEHKDEILERGKAYREANPDRVKAWAEAWCLDNKEHIAEYHKAWASDKKEILAEKGRIYRETHKDYVAAWLKAYREANPEKVAAQRRRWALANPGKAAAKTAKYRATKCEATPLWFEKKAVEAIYVEAVVRSQTEGTLYHVDHIVPMQSKLVCGLHCLDNLQILIGKDNQSKGNRVWPGKEWIIL
jgi:hypothetical protein